MNRRVWAARAAVVVLILGLVAGGASGDVPEGPADGSQLNVTPSDNLPLSSMVLVEGTGFFPFESINTVRVAQCFNFLDECGPDTPLPVDGQGNFRGSVPAVRMLTLPATGATVDCSKLDPDFLPSCGMRATDSVGRVARHHLSFSTIVPTTTTTTVRPATTPTAPAVTTTTTPRPTTTTTPTPTNPPLPTICSV